MAKKKLEVVKKTEKNNKKLTDVLNEVDDIKNESDSKLDHIPGEDVTETPDMKEDSEDESENKPLTPDETKVQLINSAIEDCVNIVKAFISIRTQRELNPVESRTLFDTYYRLAELHQAYVENKYEALKFIDEAINIGTNVIDINILAKAFLFRSQLKVLISQLTKG